MCEGATSLDFLLLSLWAIQQERPEYPDNIRERERERGITT
jgi:hypothetical protein